MAFIVIKILHSGLAIYRPPVTNQIGLKNICNILVFCPLISMKQ